MELRDYQERIVCEVKSYLNDRYRRVLVCAPTGSGKTVIAARLIDDYLREGKRILFIVHRDFLLYQTVRQVERRGIGAGLIAGGKVENRSAPLQIASVQTLARRAIDWFHPDILIFDECHITNFQAAGERLLPKLSGSMAPLEADRQHSERIRAIGLTATPYRLNPREGLHEFYETVSIAPVPAELIRSGFLTQPVYYRIERAIDTRDLKPDREGDYNTAKLEVRCNVPEVIEAAVRQWSKLAAGRKTIAFAVSVAHARAIASAIARNGVPAAVVDGTMPFKEREHLYADMESGRTLVLVSCEALGEGFDVPAVSCVLLLRPTASRAKFYQQIGRGLRVFPGKTDCIVLDQCGAIGKRGFDFVESLTEEDFSLFPGKTRKREGQDILKSCPKCDRYLYGFIKVCPNCQYEFPAPPRLEPTGDLVHDIAPLSRPIYEYYRERLKEAYHRGLDPIAAVNDTRYRFGRNLIVPVTWGRKAVFEGQFGRREKKEFEAYLRRVNRGGREEWIRERMELEFGDEKRGFYCKNF
jgi:superfamily II DNA or RNA helicase